jgi:hypothetical protein
MQVYNTQNNLKNKCSLCRKEYDVPARPAAQQRAVEREVIADINELVANYNTRQRLHDNIAKEAYRLVNESVKIASTLTYLVGIYKKKDWFFAALMMRAIPAITNIIFHFSEQEIPHDAESMANLVSLNLLARHLFQDRTANRAERVTHSIFGGAVLFPQLDRLLDSWRALKQLKEELGAELRELLP